MAINKRRKKHVWTVGDLFTIPLADGSFCIGRVIEFEPKALNSVICAFYTHRVDKIPNEEPVLSNDELISVLFVTRDLLDSGAWKVFSSSSEDFSLSKYFDISSLRNVGFVGVKIIGSGLIIELLNAYYMLSLWNDYANPDYLDSLLLSPDKKPKNVLLK